MEIDLKLYSIGISKIHYNETSYNSYQILYGKVIVLNIQRMSKLTVQIYVL